MYLSITPHERKASFFLWTISGKSTCLVPFLIPFQVQGCNIQIQIKQHLSHSVGLLSVHRLKGKQCPLSFCLSPFSLSLHFLICVGCDMRLVFKPERVFSPDFNFSNLWQEKPTLPPQDGPAHTMFGRTVFLKQLNSNLNLQPGLFLVSSLW